MTPEEQFNQFRINYPGTRLGNKTEFANFKKKHRDYLSVLPELLDRLSYIKAARARLARRGEFVPNWKHLSTWINNRCWEEEYSMDESEEEQAKNVKVLEQMARMQGCLV